MTLSELSTAAVLLRVPLIGPAVVGQPWNAPPHRRPPSGSDEGLAEGHLLGCMK